MNYKTTLIIAAIAATAFAALGSAVPVFETAYASNGGGGGGGQNGGQDGGFNNEQGDACNAFGEIENCAGNVAQSNSNFQQGEDITFEQRGGNGGQGNGGQGGNNN